ncbi:hypothetical protein F5Y04DRAFT_239507 [Hypomontagnella monticulosa]|nr:hypothetical protein F5Y04DRAFT_239507 [Hypomontagnella monticulosa]
MLVFRICQRTQWTLLRCNIIKFQNAGCRSLPTRQKFRVSSLRFETTATKTSAQASPKPPPPKYAFPERLCVYHAGTGRITFLACLKLSTLFIFVFYGFVVTPAYFNQEGLSATVLRTSLSAIVPLVFVAYTTSPFVSFIHMRLPPFARQSEEMLRRFVRTLPPTTELDITTMSFIAKPRVSKVKVSDLYKTSRVMGIANLARDTAAENASRKWYMYRAVANFNAQSNTVPRVPWVWEGVLGAIKGR